MYSLVLNRVLNGEISRADEAIANVSQVMSILSKQLAQVNKLQKEEVSQTCFFIKSKLYFWVLPFIVHL